MLLRIFKIFENKKLFYCLNVYLKIQLFNRVIIIDLLNYKNLNLFK